MKRHKKFPLEWKNLSLIIAFLLLVGCSASTPNLKLIDAASQGDTKKVQWLIHKGADVNASNGEGWTPYLAAESNGHLETMEVLKKHGANTLVSH